MEHQLADFGTEALDALTSRIAVLGEQGSILAVNEAWRRFATESDSARVTHVVGADYLNACEPGVDGEALREGLQSLLQGRRDSFEIEYPCHSPTQRRWFRIRATRVTRDGSVRIVVAIENVTARHEAELLAAEEAAAVADSESRYRTLFESIDEGFCIIEFFDGPHGPLSDYIHIEANPAYTRHAGITDVVGKTVREIVPDEADGWVKLYRNVLVTGEPIRFERELVATERHLELSAFRVEPASRRQVAVLFQDVTARRRAEAALLESQDAIRRARDYAEATLRTSPVPLLVLESDLRVASANEAFYSQFKVDPADTEGRMVYDLGNRQWDIPMLRRLLEEVLVRESRLHGYEVTHEFEGIGLRTMLLNGRRMGLQAGGSERIVLVIEDITDRKQAEASLRASEELNRSLMDGTADCVKVLDLDGRLLAMNAPGMCQMEVDDFTPLRGCIWSALWPEEARQQIELSVSRARTGQTSSFEAFCPTAKGTPKWWEVTVSPVRDRTGGQVVRLLSVSRDFTDRKQLERSRAEMLAAERTARSEAERVSRMKDEFVAMLSHELRTPLNAILGWAQILSRGTVEADDLRQGLETIQRNARVQVQMIEDLLDVSRITSGKVRLDVQRLGFCAVIEAAIDSIRPAADAKGIRVQKLLDCAADEVNGDPNRLQQVVWNLLTNAVKFTPKGGRIQVLLERVNSHVELSVSDTGKGISPEFLPHVFDRFRQADQSTTRMFGGLGLGLAIVKHLVELHAGTIQARSAGEGQGATFVVSLPLSLERKPTRISADSAEATADASVGAIAGLLGADDKPILAGLTVVYVDDEPDARELVQRVLSEHGARVITGGSAAAGRQLVTAHRPDVLVTDIGMPEEDGYSLIRKIRTEPAERGGNTPAAAVTALARSEDRRRALLAGFQTHVAKPVEPIELVAVVASLAGRTGR